MGSPAAVASEAEIGDFLASFREPGGALGLRLVVFLRHTRPELTPTIRTGWRSVNFRHKQAGHVVAVFPFAGHAALVFEHGARLDSDLLEGDGRQVRFFRLLPGAELPEATLAALIDAAVALRLSGGHKG